MAMGEKEIENTMRGRGGVRGPSKTALRLRSGQAPGGAARSGVVAEGRDFSTRARVGSRSLRMTNCQGRVLPTQHDYPTQRRPRWQPAAPFNSLALAQSCLRVWQLATPEIPMSRKSGETWGTPATLDRTAEGGCPYTCLASSKFPVRESVEKDSVRH